jgi:ABC-type glycerol-3-phosphate transport system substrate-binding protein
MVNDNDNLARTPAPVLETSLSRRQALHRAALLALGVGGIRAAGSPLMAAAAERAAMRSTHATGASFSGTITMVPWQFRPTPSMRPTALYPYPQNGLDVLAKAWQKAHPNATFQWIKQWSTDSDYQTWLTTRMTGGTEPMICFWWPPSDQFVQDGAEVNMDPYLNKPNPYIPGNPRWRDAFLPAVMSSRWGSTIDGHFYGIPLDYFETTLFVNTQALQKAGLNPHAPWSTWADFMVALGKLQKAGYPYTFNSQALWAWWPRGIIGDMIMPPSVFQQADFHHRGVTLGLDAESTARAYYKGIYTPYADYFREYLHMMKEWSQYWPPTWATPATSQAQQDQPFLTGQIPVYWSSAWSYSAFNHNPLRKVPFDLAYFPPITRATTSLAHPNATARSVGSPGDVFFVSQNAAKANAVDACVDWMMFLSTPHNDGYLCGGQPAQVDVIPVVTGATAPTAIERMMGVVNRGFVHYTIPWADPYPEAASNCDKVFQLYIGGQLSENDALKQFAHWFTWSAQQAIQKNKEAKVGTKWNVSSW